jgi:DNA-binding NtrC family response regulator
MRVLAITTAPDPINALVVEPGVSDVVIESTVSRGLALVRERRWGLVLLDSAVHEDASTELLGRIAACQPRVVLLAREWSLGVMIAALSRGAADVLPFPPNIGMLREALTRCQATPGGAARCAAAGRVARSLFVAESLPMVNVLRTVARVASTSASVLMQGESGTGKECVARLLHEHSARRAGPFVAVNCAAIPESLLESELFGCERGAFTGAVARRPGRLERASGGTLFLDEIGDMSLSLQAKILRALQEREIERVGGDRPVPVDFRLLAATNCDLRAAIAAGRFRADLYYRLAVVELHLPPLRERGEDIALLAEYLVAYFAAEHGRPVQGIADETLALLERHSWPGNVREFRNAIERAVLLADGPLLLPTHLALSGLHLVPGTAAPSRGGADRVVPLDDVVRDHILNTVALTGGRQAQAAEMLGIHRNTLRRKLQEYGVAEEGEWGTGDEPSDVQAHLPVSRERGRGADARAPRPPMPVLGLEPRGPVLALERAGS